MSTADLFPPLGVHVRMGLLELRPMTDEVLVDLCALAGKGIHDPGEMPFYFPWTQVPPEELAANTLRFHWKVRSDFTPQHWDLQFGVFVDGELVGSQGLSTRDFLITRTGETGSWVGMAHQRNGIGTRMRQAICALAFDHLDFAEVTSGAFVDNPASLAVSRKVGYTPNGRRRLKRRDGELAVLQDLVLTPATFVRGEEQVDVRGVEALRRFIGLDASPQP